MTYYVRINDIGIVWGHNVLPEVLRQRATLILPIDGAIDYSQIKIAPYTRAYYVSTSVLDSQYKFHTLTSTGIGPHIHTCAMSDLGYYLNHLRENPK